LELIEPVVEVRLNSALWVVAQVFEAKSENLDSDALGFIEEPHFSRYCISVAFLDMGVTPEVPAGSTTDPDLIYAGRHVNTLVAVLSCFSGYRSSHNL
jgi:hypothetical protein